MNNDIWNRVELIFHNALNLPIEGRTPYLQKECAGDKVLLSEVESLLRSFDNNSGFLNQPVFELGLDALNSKPKKDLKGQIIGSYQVIEKIGAGGMGEVYKALDTRLNRPVALKFLPESLENDSAAKRQLIKEAQAIAMLDHPNICAVHGIEEAEEQLFIVMQFIEGTTLAQYIASNQSLSFEDYKKIAHQILTAVAFAHSHGVIHRDLKPGNIMITNSGQIKVLDFGLAKIIENKQLPDHDSVENLNLVSHNGLIIGTVGYMSPEQLRGEKLDYRTDIFSLGIILYETLSGVNPFHRKTQAETIAAILSDLSVTAEKISINPPADLIRLIDKCVKKSRDDRYQSIAEIFVDFENMDDSFGGKFSIVKSLSSSIYYSYLTLTFFLLVVSGYFIYQISEAKVHSFAVIPIVNDTGDDNIDYLSQGLTEDIIDKFTKISGFKIKSHPTVAKYQNTKTDPITAGKELNVDIVLSGKIIKVGNELIFRLLLINIDDESQIWVNEYRLNDSNLIKTQDDILNQINAKLGLKISEEEILLSNKGQTKFPEAEEQYYRGLYYLNHRTPENLDKAINHFEKAIEIDPVFARAYSGLADSYVFKSSPAFGSLTPRESMIKAKRAANQALQFDRNLSQAFNTLGLIKLRYEWNWEEAEANFIRSIELNPDNEQPYYWYSHLLILKKDFDGALKNAQKANDLDPLSPNNEINIGRIYYYKRQNEMAAEIFERILQKNPTERGAAYMLGLTYMQKGLYEKAIDLYEKFYEKDKIYFAAQLGYAYGRVKKKVEAQRILDDLEEFAAQGKIIPPQEKAIIHLGMGNESTAFELFRKSCDDRFASLPYVVNELFFDDLKSNTKYRELIDCIKPVTQF